MPDEFREAQQREKERLHRLEKLKSQNAPSASDYEAKFVEPEDDDEDILVDCVVQKKHTVDVVELSSDEETTVSGNDDVQSGMVRAVS